VSNIGWFRSWHGAPTDPKWRTIARRAGVKPIEVAGIVWALLDYASQSVTRGSVTGFDAEVLADAFDVSAETIEAVIVALHEKGVLTDNWFMSWDKRQPNREDDSRDRVRRYRERHAEQNINETHGNATVTQGNAPDKTREDTEKKEGVYRATPCPPDFEPDAAGISTAKREKIEDVPRTVASFIDHHTSRGNSYKDWQAEWRTWCRSPYRHTTGPPASRSAVPPRKTIKDALDELTDELQQRASEPSASMLRIVGR
jgi:hypothetical protein